MDELQKPRQSLSVAIAEEVNLAVQVDLASSGRNSDAKLKSDGVVSSNGVDLAVLDANLPAVQLLQDLTDEETVDENDEPPPILVNGFVDDNEPDGTTYGQSPPQVSLSSVESPVSGINALECHPLSVVRIDECLPSLDSVLIVEKNEKFSSHSPAMNSVNYLESVQLTQHIPSATGFAPATCVPLSVTITNGFVNNYRQWVEVFASLFGNCHCLRAVFALLLKNADHCNFLSKSINSVCWQMSLPRATWQMHLVIDFNSLSHNNEPLFVLSYNEKPIVKAPQVFIQISKTEGLLHYSRVTCPLVHDYLRRMTAWVTDSVLVMSTDRDSVNLLLNHVVTAFVENGHNAEFAITQFYALASFRRVIGIELSLILEMEKQHEQRCSKTHMLDSMQGHLILLALEPDHLRAASPWASWIHLLALPGDKNGIFIVFTSQSHDSILLQENLYSPTNCNQMVSLRNFNCAAVPIVLWSDQNCKEIDQLQTHSIIIITIVLGAISESLNSQIGAVCQPRSTFCIAAVIDFLQINSAFSSSRYYSCPVVLMTTISIPPIVHLTFQACLLLIPEDKSNIDKSTSLLKFPFFTLVPQWFLLKPILDYCQLCYLLISLITPTGAFATRLVFYFGEDLHINNSDSQMCSLHAKVISLQSHTTCSWAYYLISSYCDLMFVLRNFKDNMVQNFEGAISTWGCSEHKNATKIMLSVPQVECKVDVLKALHFLFTPVVNIAHQEACGAIEAYHVELKVKLFADSHLGTLQRVHSLVHKLTTELHSGYGLDLYADKCGSFQNVNEECIASKSWHRVLQNSDSTVTMVDKSLLFAKVSSQKNSNIIHLVWIPGSELSFCDYVWSMQGNSCKHATKVYMICEGHQGWPHALITTAVSEISEISRLVISTISEKTCNPYVSSGQLSFGGLVNEYEEQFEVITASGILQSLDRWDWNKLHVAANAIVGVDYFLQAATVKELNQVVDLKYMVVSGPTTHGQMLHDKVIEFFSQLNHANARTPLSNYGNGEIKRLVQFNAALHYIDTTTVGMLNTSAAAWLHLFLHLLTNGEANLIVVTWLSKLQAHSECSTVNVDAVKLSHSLEDKAYVLRATQMTNLEKKDDLFPYFLHWGITLIIFYFEFVSTISIYGYFLFLGAAFDNMMAIQLVSILDYALGTSLHAFDRYWDKIFSLLAISTVLDPQMSKIIFGDIHDEAGTTFGRSWISSNLGALEPGEYKLRGGHVFYLVLVEV